MHSLPSPKHSLSFFGSGTTDLFQWKNRIYLLLSDYYSRFIEITRLDRTTMAEVIRRMKSIFARHGIPEVVVSDNGPQYSSQAFAEFAKDYQFRHETSSPYYPQGNGEAERAVKTFKGLLNKSDDPYKALLAYRTTPTRTGFSPCELLMGRQLNQTSEIAMVHRSCGRVEEGYCQQVEAEEKLRCSTRSKRTAAPAARRPRVASRQAG